MYENGNAGVNVLQALKSNAVVLSVSATFLTFGSGKSHKKGSEVF
jgi:hypothetical protein